MHESLQQFLFANCLSLSSVISLQFTLEVRGTAENCKKPMNFIIFWNSESFKVINVDTTKKLVTRACCFTFNAENFISSLSWSVCSEYGAIHSWNVSRSPKSPKKSYKPLFWRSRSFKVIEFIGNREPVYDFLLVINSNLGPISNRYWDTVTYWLKFANFSYPLSFCGLVRKTPFEYGKASRMLKLEHFEQPIVQIWWS